MKILGIDPGLYGACAVWWGDPKELYVYGFEQFEAHKGRGMELDGRAMADQFNIAFRGVDFAFIEDVNAHPGEGASSAFKFGTTFGIALGMLYTLGIPFDFVLPSKWVPEIVGSKMKTAEEVGKKPDKSRNMAKATNIFPAYSNLFKGTKEGGSQSKKLAEGKADAALIAYYGYCVKTGRRFR